MLFSSFVHSIAPKDIIVSEQNCFYTYTYISITGGGGGYNTARDREDKKSIQYWISAKFSSQLLACQLLRCSVVTHRPRVCSVGIGACNKGGKFKLKTGLKGECNDKGSLVYSNIKNIYYLINIIHIILITLCIHISTYFPINMRKFLLHKQIYVTVLGNERENSPINQYRYR